MIELRNLREVLAIAHYQIRNRETELKIHCCPISTSEECVEHLAIIRQALDIINAEVKKLDESQNLHTSSSQSPNPIISN